MKTRWFENSKRYRALSNFVHLLNKSLRVCIYLYLCFHCFYFTLLVNIYRSNHRLDDPDMETEAEALNGEATDSRKMEVQIGGAVTLECDGGCWGHGPGMDPVGGPGPLALSRVVYQEAGEYRCVAPDRKMQDTWRAQLPYHIKVTGKSRYTNTIIPIVSSSFFLLLLLF